MPEEYLTELKFNTFSLSLKVYGYNPIMPAVLLRHCYASKAIPGTNYDVYFILVTWSIAFHHRARGSLYPISADHMTTKLESSG